MVNQIKRVMKELSTEEKAKRYDEAIERAKEWSETKNGYYTPKEFCEEIFPELKESEDERIRKWIINEIKIKHHNLDEDNIDFVDKAISWLEKQGQTFTKKDVDDAYLKGVCDAKHELEKQGEQKPTDKVEPKFNVGDWIVTPENKVLQITDIEGASYVFNNESHYWEIYYCDKRCHLWDLTKDAKDGDVLCVKYGNDEMPFIFTGKQDDVAYCALNSFGEFVLSMVDWLLKTSVLPATKEQRDLLFQKMKEAGYKWNEEKKVVEKIKPKFKVGDWVVWKDKCNKVNYDGCGYELVDQNGLSTSLEYRTLDENAHLWTIEDAKDGDVLCTYECCEPKIVFILKGTSKKHRALRYYCYYNIMYPYFEHDFNTGGLMPNEEDVKPATKEQRDTLFAKIKESGYEWNADKKELIKL